MMKKAAIYAFLRLWRSFSIYAKGGAGILWTKYIDRDGWLQSGNNNYFYETVNKVTARSPIYQAGLGFIFEIESGIRLFLEGIYHKAEVKGFSGENIRSVSEAVLDLSSFSIKIGLIVRF